MGFNGNVFVGIEIRCNCNMRLHCVLIPLPLTTIFYYSHFFIQCLMFKIDFYNFKFQPFIAITSCSRVYPNDSTYCKVFMSAMDVINDYDWGYVLTSVFWVFKLGCMWHNSPLVLCGWISHGLSTTARGGKQCCFLRERCD